MGPVPPYNQRVACLAREGATMPDFRPSLEGDIPVKVPEPDGPWPDVAIPPGDTLAETLEYEGLTQQELAQRTGRPVQAISEIIRGEKAITPETALQFERVLGVPAHVWLNLERFYRLNKARVSREEARRQ